MKKNNYTAMITGLIFFVMLFVFSEKFIIGINSGLMNCARIVIPSAFPFLIASSLTGCGRLPAPLKKIIEPITRFLFRLPADTVTAIILGQLGGYLAGAKAAESMRKNGIITRSQSERLTLFCINAGMGFSVNAVGNAMLCSREAGRILLYSLCLSSLLTGFILRFFKINDSDTASPRPAKRISLPDAVTGSVSSASYAMLNVCGFVTLFSGICAVINSFINNETAKAVVTSLLEVTTGCVYLSGKTSLPIIALFCAFGSLCIHLQVFSINRVNFFRFFLFRIIHSASAYLICRIMLHFNPVESPVFLSFYEHAAPFSFSAPAAISLVFLSFLLILDLDNGKKIC